MSQQRRIQKPRVRVQRNTRTEVIEERQTRSEERREAIERELDDVLDEIDDVLEQNAEQFVKDFVQKGGE